MQISKIKAYLFPVVILLLLNITACIEEYNLEIDEYKNLLVIEGSIIKEDSIQTVKISQTTPIDKPDSINPVSGCQVNVVNGNGLEFFFDETSPGTYTAKIPQENLQFNEKFKLQVTTPDGNKYASHYETILECSPVDSIYPIAKKYQSAALQFESGLQYYIDLKAPDSFTRNYRWAMVETWEYHAPYSLDAIFYVTGWDSWGHPIGYFDYDPEHFLDTICWQTKKVSVLSSSSTRNLTVNEKKKIPLNYIPGTSIKLSVKYSLLVKQYSLSDSAYLFWNQNKVETQESGGLYQSQPGQAISNIRNVNNSSEIVLGFFWASSFTEKRVFYQGPFPDWECDCHLIPFKLGEYYNGTGKEDWLHDMNDPPIPGSFKPGISLARCMDCTARGGTAIKPDFWED